MIVVKNSGLFQKETKKKVSGLKELRETLEIYIKENLEDIKENLVLIFVEDNVEKLKITKTVEEIGGAICEFEYQKPLQIEKRLEAIAKAYKVDVESGAIRDLIEVSGTSMQVLINEIRKLIEYAGEGGTITRKSVKDLAIKTLDSNIFDLTDNLREKEYRRSIKNIRRALVSKRANTENINYNV